MPCTFEGLPFMLKVVDSQTQKPLSDVHALAEWQMYGAGGRLNGPAMALDAVSDADGVMRFPGWGPVKGSVLGIGIGRDPLITLYKRHYRTLRIINGGPPGMKDTERTRRFYQDGYTFRLTPFEGTAAERLEDLNRAGGLPRSDENSLRFRAAYLNRTKRLSLEREDFSPELLRPGSFLWHLDRTLKLLEEGHR
jgi:hypothetical protein